MKMTRTEKILLAILMILLTMALLVTTHSVYAGGNCPPGGNYGPYLNDCSTWPKEIGHKVDQGGVEFSIEYGKVDRSTSGNSPEVIVTTGDVNCRFSNCCGIKEVTGDVLFRELVEDEQVWTGAFPLSPGEHTLTVYTGQEECANCPYLEEFTFIVPEGGTTLEPRCKPTGRFTYTYFPAGNSELSVCNLVFDTRKPARALDEAYIRQNCSSDCKVFRWNGDWVMNKEKNCNGNRLVAGNHYDTSVGTLVCE